MKKKIIGLITAAAMLVSSVSALAESEAVRLAQDSNVLTEEAVDSSIVGDEEETALGDENVQPEEAVVSSEEEETVSNEIPDEEEETFNDDVLLPDNTQQPLSLSGMYDASYDINNTILTPEEQKREAEFEAKLRAEMAEEEMNGETAELADSIPTYNQFLADDIYENGHGRRYSLYKNDFSTPYRAYVQKYKSDPTWQSLLGAWRIATFSLSDITSYSNKEVAYYETILFDMLYQGNDVLSLTGELKKAANSIEISTLSKVAKLEDETTFDFIKKMFLH